MADLFNSQSGSDIFICCKSKEKGDRSQFPCLRRKKELVTKMV